MGYKRKRWWCRNGVMVMEYHTPLRYPPGEHRAKREKPTPEAKRQANQRRKALEVQRLILHNFSEGDKYVTLTYASGDAPDMETVRKDLRHLTEWLKRQYAKTGLELKWIRNIERTKRGVIHIHMLVNNPPGRDMGREIRSWWKERHGTIVKVSDTYLDGAFAKLAAYLSKSQRDESGAMTSRYSRSRNLVVPDPEIKEFARWNVRRKGVWIDPRIPKGYELVKESLYEGIDLITGYPIRYYTLIRSGTGGTCGTRKA